MRYAKWFVPLGALAFVAFLVLSLTRVVGMPPPERGDVALRPWPAMRVALDVLVDGKRVPTVHYQGKTYLPVRRLGTEYQIRVWNYGSRRITAIVSVDGLSVMNGRPASHRQPGYIVAPHSSITIDGWRRDNDTVAAFSFEERANSYASKIGHPENIGVIGLVAFEEMRRWPRPLPMERKRAASGAERYGSSPVGGTGTGYGRDIHSPVIEVPFVRSSNRQTITVYYDTVQNLRREGIPVDRPYPMPFPADRTITR